MATIRIEICENLKNLLFFLSLPYVFTTSDDICNYVCNSYESFVSALSRSSVAGIATRLQAALFGFQIPVGQQIIVFSKTERSALGFFPGDNSARA
jgi:hypothetical protein